MSASQVSQTYAEREYGATLGKYLTRNLQPLPEAKSFQKTRNGDGEDLRKLLG